MNRARNLNAFWFGRLFLGFILAAQFMPASALAETYGQGTYNAGQFSPKTITLGPIGPIPLTGPSMWGMVAAATLSIAVGLIVWRRLSKSRNA